MKSEDIIFHKLTSIFHSKRESFNDYENWIDYLKNNSLGFSLADVDDDADVMFIADWIINGDKSNWIVIRADWIDKQCWIKIPKSLSKKIVTLGGLP